VSVQADQLVGLLEQVLAHGDSHGRARISPGFAVIVDGQPALWVWAEDHSREQIAMAMMTAQKGMAGEGLMHVADAYSVKTRTKHDGSEWTRGELEMQWVTDGPDKDLITEALHCTFMDRDSHALAASMTYENRDGVLVKTGVNIMEESEDGQQRMAGYYADKMRLIMQEPTVERPEPENPIEADFYRLASTAVVTRLLAAWGFEVQVGVESLDEVEAMKEIVEKAEELGMPFDEVPEFFKEAHDTEFQWPNEEPFD
jgi:hypothetical protein